MPELKFLKSKKDKDKNEKPNKKDKAGKKGKAALNAEISLDSIKGLVHKPRGKMPTKTTINLARTEAGPVSLKRVVPVVVLITLVCLVLGKFFIIDKLVAVSKANEEVSRLQAQLQETYSALGSFSDVEDTYAHYTYSGMTEEELGLVDRVDIMDLIATTLTTGDVTKSWSLTGNILTIQMTGTSLNELNELSRQLEQSDIVDQCILSTANKIDRDKLRENVYTDVDATFVIYLKNPDEDTGENAGQENGQGDSVEESQNKLRQDVQNIINSTTEEVNVE